jgi:hypothetical protein
LDTTTKWVLAHPEKDRFSLSHGRAVYQAFADETAIYGVSCAALKN